MDHQAATQLEAVDKYLLNELTPQVRDEFEEHFFDCQECSTDLRATSAFIESAREEFITRPLVKPEETALAARPKVSAIWRPAALTFALAASLLVIVYQNVVVYPRFRSEISQLQAPQVLPTVSLIGANSRGGANGPVAIGKAKRIELVFEIPAHDRFTSYGCLLYSPSGALLGKVQISSQAAKDTITMDAPTGARQSGTYSLVIQGQTAEAATGTGVEVTRFSFELASQ